MGGGTFITKVADIRALLAQGRRDPSAALPKVRELAASQSWQVREVAATAMVELAKRHPAAVLAEASRWARDADANIRRAGSEGLRGLVQHDPEGVRPVLERLRADPSRYVRKSVANVLRNASRTQPDFVLKLCKMWVRTADPNTQWVVREGLRKLVAMRSAQAAEILDKLTVSV